MSTEAEELHGIIAVSVRDMLDACRIQAQARLCHRAPGVAGV